jgi:LysR family transcriptional regulator, hydrogen peroxide-inducible genes activator
MLLRQLEYILAVEEHKSFTKAADVCCVTQPTLSQQIKSLEDSLNIEIFDRSRLPVLPTEKGRLILEKARLVVQEAQSLKAFAKTIARKERRSAPNGAFAASVA